MTATSLASALDPGLFGGKAVQLGAAIRAGLPVPAGVALPVDLVEGIARHCEDARAELVRAVREIGGPLAVRSSAVGEDGAAASFAGQHLTVLNVAGPEAAEEAVRQVRDSGHAAAALAYRRRQGLDDSPRVGVVLQRLVAPDRAGVLFTRDPMTGEDVRVIEASWGLGEAVVSGLVTPDLYRVDRDGRVLSVEPGDKALVLWPLPGGGTVEDEADGDRAAAPCLSGQDVARLHALAARCEATYGPDLDIEWAIADGQPILLQVRAITRLGGAAAA